AAAWSPWMSALAHLIPADFARRHLRTGRELVRERQRQPSEHLLSTGVKAFDAALGGGLRRGALHELSGRRGGRFSLVLEALAAATAGGDAAALIDLGDGLDPQLAKRAGVVLERVLWVRPRTLKEALASAEAILATAMPLITLDLGLPPIPGGRGHEASWLRLARQAQDQRVALLVSSPYRVSGTTAHAVVELRQHRVGWSGEGARARLLDGLGGQLEMVKGDRDRVATPYDVRWRVPSAVAPNPAEAKATPTRSATATAPSGRGQAGAPRPQTARPRRSPSSAAGSRLRAIA
ncbi:MAG: hypothetical protein AAGM22_19560, partial [Acidobacteriota bacterium]